MEAKEIKMNKWIRVLLGLFCFFLGLARLSVFLILVSGFMLFYLFLFIDIFNNTKVSYFFFTDNFAEILVFYFVFSAGVIAIRYLLFGSDSIAKLSDVFYKAPKGDGFIFIDGMGDRDDNLTTIDTLKEKIIDLIYGGIDIGINEHHLTDNGFNISFLDGSSFEISIKKQSGLNRPLLIRIEDEYKMSILP